MSRSLHFCQPPGGHSSLSLSWNEHRQTNEQRHPSRSSQQPTSRRNHEVSMASSCDFNGERRSSSVRHIPSRQAHSHRRDDVEKAPPVSCHSHNRVGGGKRIASMPMSARGPEPKSRSSQHHRKMETSRSSVQFGHARCTGDRRLDTARSRFTDTEPATASRGLYSGREGCPSRTIPGEEMHAPMHNPWMEPALRRSTKRVDPRCSVNAVPSKGIKACRFDLEGPKLRPEKDPARSRITTESYFRHHEWPMDSSIASSAQCSVLDSSPQDLWDASSIDSLPLGAEWFNFMHRGR
jgi:hypothetical protein